MKQISENERSEYRAILRKEFGKKEDRKVEYPEVFCVNFKDGIQLINDTKNNKVTLINKDKKFEINSWLPEDVALILSQDGKAEYRHQTKDIVCPPVLDEIDLFVLLHEIGHVWDCIKNQDLYKNDSDKDDSEKMRIIKERNSWAWALKKIKQLKKDNFISRKITDREFIVNAKACLYTYAMLLKYGHNDQYVKLLNRELEEIDSRIFERNFVYSMKWKSDTDEDKKYDL